MATTTDIYLGELYNVTKTNLRATETALASDITGLAGTTEQPTQAVLLGIQYRMQVFQFFAEFVSTFEKKISEAFQGIVRNF